MVVMKFAGWKNVKKPSQQRVLGCFYPKYGTGRYEIERFVKERGSLTDFCFGSCIIWAERHSDHDDVDWATYSTRDTLEFCEGPSGVYQIHWVSNP